MRFKTPFLLFRQKKRGFVSPKKKRSRGSSKRKRLPTLPFETLSDARSRRRGYSSATQHRRAVRLHICHRTVATLLPGSTALSRREGVGKFIHLTPALREEIQAIIAHYLPILSGFQRPQPLADSQTAPI